MHLLAELKRRNVIRMAGLYLIGAWLVVQVSETLLPIFGTPGWVLKTLVLLLALGFVPALVFAWVFELTPHGLTRDRDADPAREGIARTAPRLDVAVIVAVLAIGVLMLWQQRQRVDDGPVPGSAAAVPAVAEVPQAAPPASPQVSLAVLPFTNMSGRGDEDYFSDGMTEELLNVLAKVPRLHVAARTSVFQFKDKGGDVREIGKQLGVDHIVEGSVRRDGEQVRVTAQLVRVADGFHVWSESYDRELKSVFALQDDIARRIAEALSRTLDVQPATAVRAPVDPRAYDDYLKGRQLLRQRTDLPQAIAYFQSAVAKAPEFAAGWSSLSLAHDVIHWYERQDRDEAVATLARAAEAAERAAALDPGAAASTHALANVARAQFRYADAERHYLRAMQLDPSYSDAREDYSELLFLVGRMEESARACRELVSLDPYFPVGWMRLISASIALDSREDVREAQRRLREIAPGNYMARLGALDHALAHGRAEEARAALAELQPHYPDEAELLKSLVPWALGQASLDPAVASAALARLPGGEASVYLIARHDVAGYHEYVDSVGPIGQTYYFADFYQSRHAGHSMLRDPRVKARLVEFGFVAYWREHGWPPGCRALGEADFECGAPIAGAG
ncbi:MAG TPA: hypothetical protein VFO79_11700 [Xanthomonadales bacterium]|nr:hypothetical protein [Xanthomonadales bacterium]